MRGKAGMFCRRAGSVVGNQLLVRYVVAGGGAGQIRYGTTAFDRGVEITAIVGQLGQSSRLGPIVAVGSNQANPTSNIPPNSVLVFDAGLADANGIYTADLTSIFNGQPLYRKQLDDDSLGNAFDIRWGGSQWFLVVAGLGFVYALSTDVNRPARPAPEALQFPPAPLVLDYPLPGDSGSSGGWIFVDYAETFPALIINGLSSPGGEPSIVDGKRTYYFNTGSGTIVFP